MNLTCQYIANPKSREAYVSSDATYQSIRTTSTKLRLGENRCVLFLKEMKEKVFRVGGIKFKMIRCQRGMFMMGADTKDDNPKRPIAIERPFLLCETEVTQELFETIMGYNPSVFQGKEYPNSKQRPVEQVTWYDAVMFCNKLSLKLGKKLYYNVSNEQYFDENQKTNIKEAIVTINPKANGFRLPYEKEWEYAAKAGTDNQWAGTNDINKVKDVAWFEDNSNKQTQPVKSKLPNRWGIYDMGGNVKEICADLSPSHGEGSSILIGFHAGGGMMNLNMFYSVISPLRKGVGMLGANGEVGFRIVLSTKQDASLFRKNPKDKKQKKTAVIIKGNPYFMQGEYKAKYEAFYDHVKSILLNVGYDRVMFDDGEEGTVPPQANLWVAHSRGKGRLKFVPFGTQTLILDDYEDVCKEYDMELKAIKEKLGVTNMNEIPLSLRPIPRENHYTVNSKMQIALEKTI